MRLVVAGSLAACGGGAPADGDSSADATDDVPADAAAADAAPAKLVRFITLGDTGQGNEDQRRVAVAARDLCAARGCDFALLLGDNIYDEGVETTADPAWQTKFEIPYADLDLTFHVALGNHDFGGHLVVDLAGLGNEFERGQAEIDYSAVSSKWSLPAAHYTFTAGHVGFVVLDTNSIIWDNTDYGDQAAWLPTALAETADRDWRFIVGHHPYRSNGQHGNAGTYEIVDFVPPVPVPALSGSRWKEFADDHLCGVGDVYFSGHDHSRQWLDEPDALCGTELIVNGAGAEFTSLVDNGNDAFYQDASKPGFMYVVVDGDTFTGEFYDADGNLDYSRSFERQP